MSKVIIMPGPCKFITSVEAEKIDRKTARIKIETACSFYKPLEETLTEIDVRSALYSPLGEGQVYEALKANCKHGSCPVASGILKAIEAACGYALPTDVTITFEK